MIIFKLKKKAVDWIWLVQIGSSCSILIGIQPMTSKRWLVCGAMDRRNLALFIGYFQINILFNKSKAKIIHKKLCFLLLPVNFKTKVVSIIIHKINCMLKSVFLKILFFKIFLNNIFLYTYKLISSFAVFWPHHP